MRSGIAAYTRELVSELSTRHAVEVFVGSAAEQQAAQGAAAWSVRSAHEYVWARERTPYDLVIYQMGNASCHDYMWPYLFGWPGLVVLHDAHLHHARASALLRRRRQDDYRAELRFNHPEAGAAAAEIAISGFAGPVYYFWPMLRSVAASARALAVHDAGLADNLRAAHPHTPVHVVPMGVADPAAAPDREATRQRLGFTDDMVVIAAVGAVTPEKRIVELMTAFALARPYQPHARLLLVGQPLPHFDARRRAHDLGIADVVTVTGYVADAELPAYLQASDIISSLRWPTGRETSASWIRALGAGRPTLITDLAQHADVPTLDPRSGKVLRARTRTAEPESEPIAVSIDLRDEMHSLTRALKRLVTDAPLRVRLGVAARRYWDTHHTLPQMAAAYETAMADAAARPDPASPLPPHLRADGAAHTRALLASLGARDPFAR